MDKQLIQSFYDQADQEQAKYMAGYMKDQFPFLGIKKPQRAELQKDFLKQVKKRKNLDWDFVFEL